MSKEIKEKMKKKKLIITAAAVLILVVIMMAVKCGKNSENSGDIQIDTVKYEKTYLKYLEQNKYVGNMAADSVKIDISKFEVSNGMNAEYKNGAVETADEGSITFSFNVKETGFYNLKIKYLPLKGTTSEIQRKMSVDGTTLYNGLTQIAFKRKYRDEEIKIKGKNEIRPSAKEVIEPNEVWIEDYNRRNGAPYLFYLEKGEHTLTFESVKEPVSFMEITFEAKEKEESYEDVIEKLKAIYSVYDKETLIGQAERVDGITSDIVKSSSSININKNYSDANLMPYHPYHIVYNTIGGTSYKTSGDMITWTLEAPEEGLYEITIKARQAVNRGVTSYRRVYVNGVVPFEEMNSVSFDYSSDMKNFTLSDGEGTPYLFYLKKGSNTLSMEVVLGELGGLLTEVEESMYNLNQLYLKTIQITGTTPSVYIDYEIRKKIDGYTNTLLNEADHLNHAIDVLVAITGEKGEKTALLDKMAIEASTLAKDPESVTEELTRWKDNIAALGTWTVSIAEMPLEVDAIMLSAPNAKLPKATAGPFKSFFTGIRRFFASFFVKTNEVTSDTEVKGGDNVLTVWMVSSGKEQAQILQNMIDESFTPIYGINVKLQLIPDSVVLKAALSGEGADVLVGLPQEKLADFAERNALADISKFDGFENERARFYDSAITGATYLDGVYGLPEQQKFSMLFYREDVLNSLGLGIPRTWEDFKAMIPILQRNNYSVCMPKSEFLSSLVFQYGADFYEGEGADYGIASGLADDRSLKAFKDLTDYFTAYKLPVTVDFSNRFRTGEIPVGIVSYTTFSNLEIFAPEIKGLWSFAPIPGVMKEDGTIDNTFVTDTVQAVIMKDCDDYDDAWTFLKWWTGADAQLTYANTIESVMGTASRYAPADKKVLEQLPWSASEYKMLVSQLENSKGIPAVPGSYMTTRMISYSFDAVVSDNSNPRETLYLNVKDINKELTKKREEFGLSVKTK